jgi:hypothetical protein
VESPFFQLAQLIASVDDPRVGGSRYMRGSFCGGHDMRIEWQNDKGVLLKEKGEEKGL